MTRRLILQRNFLQITSVLDSCGLRVGCTWNRAHAHYQTNHLRDCQVKTQSAMQIYGVGYQSRSLVEGWPYVHNLGMGRRDGGRVEKKEISLEILVRRLTKMDDRYCFSCLITVEIDQSYRIHCLSRSITLLIECFNICSSELEEELLETC